MRIFFDCEFIEDGVTIKLVSLGAVREDGVKFYAVNADLRDYDFARADQWVFNNVLSQLEKRDHRQPELAPGVKPFRGADLPPYLKFDYVQTWRTPLEIRKDFREFAGNNPIFYAWYADYDWVCLCQLFGAMVNLPQGWPMYCRDLKQTADLFEIDCSDIRSEREHHALADADQVRRIYERITKRFHDRGWYALRP